MGKIYSPLAGQIRGRVGDTVFRKGQRATVASKYQPQVANPKSIAQAIRRCAFATVSAAQSSLNFLVNHSFEGVRGKRANLQRFVKENVNVLAADIKRTVIEQGYGMDGMVNIKGNPGIQCAPFIVSRGSLPFATEQYITSQGNVYGLNLVSGVAADGWGATIDTDEKFAAALALIGLEPGDQLSLVSILSEETASARYNGYDNYACRVVGSRVTFKTRIPENFSGTLTDVGGTFNPALIERSEGNLKVATLGEAAGPFDIVVYDGGRNVNVGEMTLGAAAIRSKIDQNGKYLYSTQKIVMDESLEDQFPDGALASYMAAAPSDLESDNFLDNPLLAV